MTAYHCRHDKGKANTGNDLRATGGWSGAENTAATAAYVGGKQGVSTNCGRHYKEGLKQAKAKKIGIIILIPIVLIFGTVLVIMALH